ELQQKTEQQEKILKLKDEEIAAFKRQNSSETPRQLQKLEEKKKWLDEELEKVLHQRQELANLEEDLKRREAIISKKETLIQEKSHLEIKKLRSSQALNKDSLRLSNRLTMLDQELCDKNIKLQSSPSDEQGKILEEVQALQKERDQLLKRRNSVDEKLKDGRVLSLEEEHVLFQLEEGIEALEAAIAYKNESIQNHQNSLRASSQIFTQNEANMMGKLVSLSAHELRAILLKYFNKVVGLRETERKLQLQNEELGMRAVEQENIVRELELALEHLMLQCNYSGDGILNQEPISVNSEELKRTSKLSGKLKETDHYVGGLGAHQNSQKIEELAELIPNTWCLSSSQEERAGKVQQPAKFHPQVLCHSQTKDNGTQLQGVVTPVKLSRKELRHIPASELSSRRSSLAVGVNSVPADSIEMSRKSNDYNR
ncbi:hypothetical protein lerEdw1_000809, partial [Lerista edwardsae]